MKLRHEENDKIEVVLGELSGESEKAGLEIQKKSGRIIKAAVEKKLAALKYKQRGEGRRPIHMAEDVHIVTKNDEYGNKVVKVMGGKRTGTLWHIVNDGTYRSRAAHFMDQAIAESEAAVEDIVSSELGKVFGK